MVTVPDPRLQQLSSISGSRETVRTCQGPCRAQGVGVLPTHYISSFAVAAVKATDSTSSCRSTCRCQVFGNIQSPCSTPFGSMHILAYIVVRRVGAVLGAAEIRPHIAVPCGCYGRCPPLWSLWTLLVWCGVPARVRGWATSFSPTSGRQMPFVRWAQLCCPATARDCSPRVVDSSSNRRRDRVCPAEQPASLWAFAVAWAGLMQSNTPPV